MRKLPVCACERGPMLLDDPTRCTRCGRLVPYAKPPGPSVMGLAEAMAHKTGLFERKMPTRKRK
jgi:hypothetical protein